MGSHSHMAHVRVKKSSSKIKRFKWCSSCCWVTFSICI